MDQYQAPIFVLKDTNPRTSNLGIASLILAIIAICVAWIPFVGMVTFPFSFVGLVLAFVALVVGGPEIKKGLPVVGLLLNMMAMAMPFVLPLIFGGLLIAGAQNFKNELDKAKAGMARETESPTEQPAAVFAVEQPAPQPRRTMTLSPTPRSERDSRTYNPPAEMSDRQIEEARAMHEEIRRSAAETLPTGPAVKPPRPPE